MSLRFWPLPLACLLLAFVPATSAEPACDVSGTWQDNFGTIYLRMTAGGSVSGNYTWQNGTMAGVLDGVFLNGTWAEEPTFAGPRDAGRFSWQFGEDCSVFTGTYSYAEDPEGVAGSWSGSRIGEAPPPQPPRGPACDPRGEWTSNHGRIYFFTHDGLADLQAQWELRDDVVTMNGTFSDQRYEGRYQRPDGASHHFVIVFDQTCGTFQGDWSDEALIYKWNGERALTPTTPEESVQSPTEPATPSPTSAPPATPPPPTDDSAEHLPGLGEDAQDPLGIPAPGLPLVLVTLSAMALALRRIR